jgi:transcriptional regulator with XRE-family HTH domain
MRKRLLKNMEKKNISQKYLSETLGVSIGVINKFFTQEKEIAFDIVWKIVKLLEPDNVVDLMDKYSDEVTKKNIKLALEYYSLNRRLESLNKIINKARQCSDELREWARVYTLVCDFQKNAYYTDDPNYLVNLFRRVDTPFKETRLLLYIFEMYAYYYRNEFKSLYTFLVNLPSDILEIEHAFLRRCYMARVDELMCYAEIKYHSNSVAARTYCEKVLELDIADNLNANAYFNKGLSYLIEDFDKCVFNYRKCLEYYERIGRQAVIDDLHQQIEFAHIIWDKETTFTSEFHRLMADVKHGRADHTVLDPFQSTDTLPYIYYIKGIALNDKEYLIRSMHQFRRKGDLFRAKLPALELAEKHGYSELVLSEVLTI